MSNPLTIDSFVSHFAARNGFARGNSFMVYIDIDSAGNAQGVNATNGAGGIKQTLKSFGLTPEHLTIQAQNVELPTKGLLTKEIFTQNVPVPMGYNFQYSDLTMGFLMDNSVENMNVWNFFNAWMNMIVNPSSHYVGYHNDYSCNIYVSTMAQSISKAKMGPGVANPNTESNSKPINIKFHNCFPKTISSVAMDASSTGEPLKLNVTFAIKKFEDYTWDDWTQKGVKNAVTAQA